MAVLDIRNLDVRFSTDDGEVCAVNNLNLTVEKGEVLGIVGESGSGKSQSWLAVMGLLARNGKASGSVKLGGEEILNLPTKALTKLRGARIGMIFQDPMTALNPFLSVGQQMIEVLQVHRGMSKKAAAKKAIASLEAVHITSAERRLSMYPHEFSGGMRQRVMIAMALLTDPELLICDEPTTALDVTVQMQILALLDELRIRFGTAIVFITHDLGVVAQIADRVSVMYGGRQVEHAEVHQLFADYRHPYTEGLLASVPRLDAPRTERLPTIPGLPPNLATLPAGCPFAPRCRYATEQCRQSMPALEEAANGHLFACYHQGPLQLEATQ
ncbi:ABC transporter ATP-binding protein [Gallaecimonas mangrovi]|uniref:ABC transporter ATP-binding protein n=1 Tax=Gallaecimonas mangrovi TaxID=2291597 RepID=UPI000E202F98|nr:oligopeptide/dipeptide ABC transporter ATP-binding protein [Gallaecimonas mangrovi]